MFVCKQSSRAQRNCSLFLDGYKNLYDLSENVLKKENGGLYSENTVFLYLDSQNQTNFTVLLIKMSKRGSEHQDKVFFHLQIILTLHK